MRSSLSLLFVFLAIASIQAVDDAFLQKHAHRLVSTPIQEIGDNCELGEHADLAHIIGLCTHNLDGTANNGDASVCMGNSWKDKKKTPLMLMTVLKQGVKSVHNLNIDVGIYDDAVFKGDVQKSLRWTSTGNIIFSDRLIPYISSGGISHEGNTITLEEEASIYWHNVTATAVVYVTVNVDQSPIRANLHYNASVVIFDQDAGVSGDVLISISHDFHKTGGDLKVKARYTIASTQNSYISDSTQNAPSVTSNSEVLAGDMDLVISNHTSSIEVIAKDGFSGARLTYKDGQPSSWKDYSVESSQNASMKWNEYVFMMENHGSLTAVSQSGDLGKENQVIVNEVSGSLNGRVDILELAENSYDAEEYFKVSLEVKSTPVKGNPVSYTVSEVINAQSLVTVVDDNTFKTHTSNLMSFNIDRN